MLFGLLIYQGCDHKRAERYIEGDLKEEPCPYLSGRTMRAAMQTLGTEWGRQLMGTDFWVNALENHVEHMGYDRIAISDVRNDNEVGFIHTRGGRVCRITRGREDRATDTHASETAVAGLTVDHCVPNDGTVADLHARIRSITGV